MTHSQIQKILRLTFIFSFLLGLVCQIALIVSGAAESPLIRWRLLGFALAGLSLAAIFLWRWGWGRQQTAVNQREHICLSLAPRPGRDLVVCDFWRRVPGSYLTRGRGELPGDHLSMELGGDHSQTCFSFTLPPHLRQTIATEAAHEWPKVEIREMVRAAADIGPGEAGEVLVDLPHRGQGPWCWQTFTLVEPDYQPLHTVDLRYGQPRPPAKVSGLLVAVEATPVGMVSGIQVLVRPAPTSKRGSWTRRANLLRRQLGNRGSHSSTRTQEGEGVSVRTATSRQYGPVNVDALQADLLRLTTRLADGPLYEVCLRVWACGTQAEAEAARLGTAVVALTRSPWNQLEVDEQGSEGEAIIGRHFPTKGGFLITAGELGQLLHLPNQEEAAPYARLHTAGAEPLAPEGRIAVALEETALAGGGRLARKRVYGQHQRSSGAAVLVGHDFRDATMHTFIVGATGAGKSVLAANLVRQDWLAGHAALVLDPHRTLIDDILRGVPRHREGDVILLDPGDVRQPFRWNLFDTGGGTDTAVERLMAAIRVGMGASWESSVGMQEVLFHTLTLALASPGTAAMTTVLALLGGSERTLLLQNMTTASPQVQQALTFWEKTFPGWHKQDQQRALGAARRRIENITRRGLVRRTLGMPGTTVNLAAALNSSKLVLCPMHEEMGAETKRIWSALLLQELIRLLLARDPGADLPRVTIAIDELAESVGTLADFLRTLLNETRKYGAAVLLMNQSYVALPQAVRQVILGNCRSQIAMSLGAEDAEVAARIMGDPVQTVDLQRLRPFHAYARLAVSGGQASPCLLRTLPPVEEEPAPRPQRPLLRQPLSPLPDGIPAPDAPLPAVLSPDLTPAELLTWARRVDPSDQEAASQLLGVLQQLPTAQYDELCRLKRASDDWWRQQIEADPGQVPDKVARIQLLSRLRYGIPWWQSDADYLREVGGAQGGRQSLSADTQPKPRQRVL